MYLFCVVSAASLSLSTAKINMYLMVVWTNDAVYLKCINKEFEG